MHFVNNVKYKSFMHFSAKLRFLLRNSYKEYLWFLRSFVSRLLFKMVFKCQTDSFLKEVSFLFYFSFMTFISCVNNPNKYKFLFISNWSFNQKLFSANQPHWIEKLQKGKTNWSTVLMLFWKIQFCFQKVVDRYHMECIANLCLYLVTFVFSIN